MEDNEDIITDGHEEELTKTINEVAENAAPIREEIINELKPKLKFNKRDFATTYVGASHKGEDLDKKEKRELLSQAGWEFDKVKDFFHFQEVDGKPDKVETLLKQVAVCVKWLDYIGQSHLWNYWLDKFGLDITVKEQKECNTFFDKSDDNVMTKSSISACFVNADDTLASIEEKEQMIKEDNFEMLPDDVKYSKENKRGLKPSQFDSIVTIKALKNIEEAKATKKANDMADKAMDGIVVNRIIFNTIEPDTVEN